MNLLYFGLDYLSFDCFETHAGEEDDEDGYDDHWNETSGCGVVLGLTVVSDQFGGGEEIKCSESFRGGWENCWHVLLI